MPATDQELFDQAISDLPSEQNENVPEPPVDAPTEAKAERARDEHGRFVPKAPEAPMAVAQDATLQPEAESEPNQPETDARVPSWRLAEESQRRREAEQQLNQIRSEFRDMQTQFMQMAQMRQQPQQQEPIDPFADPQGFVQNLQSTFEQRLRERDLQHSLQFARFAHKDTFDRAYEAFVDYAHRTRDQATYQRVMQSADPGEALVQWHKEQELHRELGGTDLKSFLAKREEELLKDPAFQAKVIEAFKATQQAQPSSAVTNLPPSLSRATSAAPNFDPGDDDVSGEGLYRYATAKR